eukprot:2708704-Rhodomonas_salina.2
MTYFGSSLRVPVTVPGYRDPFDRRSSTVPGSRIPTREFLPGNVGNVVLIAYPGTRVGMANVHEKLGKSPTRVLELGVPGTATAGIPRVP